MHTQPTQWTLLEQLAPETIREPHYWASQDAFYTKLFFKNQERYLVLIYRNKHRKLGKMRRQRKIFQTIQQDKTSEKEPNTMAINNLAISNLPDKEFRVMFIKMLAKRRREMKEYNENFSKNGENIKKNQSVQKNTIT